MRSDNNRSFFLSLFGDVGIRALITDALVHSEDAEDFAQGFEPFVASLLESIQGFTQFPVLCFAVFAYICDVYTVLE